LLVLVLPVILVIAVSIAWVLHDYQSIRKARLAQLQIKTKIKEMARKPGAEGRDD
jgi:hypothetical protein